VPDVITSTHTSNKVQHHLPPLHLSAPHSYLRGMAGCSTG
jgi:hypothetical protein